MSSDIYFNIANWFLGNVAPNPISTHSVCVCGGGGVSNVHSGYNFAPPPGWDVVCFKNMGVTWHPWYSWLQQACMTTTQILSKVWKLWTSALLIKLFDNFLRLFLQIFHIGSYFKQLYCVCCCCQRFVTRTVNREDLHSHLQLFLDV